MFYHKIVNDTRQIFKENKMIFVCCVARGGRQEEDSWKKKSQGTGMLQKKSVLPQAFGFSQNICHMAITF